jgi:hypothetical protein
MSYIGRPETVFATIATADRADAGIGVVWFAHTPRGRYLLHVLDYDLSGMNQVGGPWIRALFERGAELAKRWRAMDTGCIAWAEPGALLDLLAAACRTWTATAPSLSRDEYDLCEIPQTTSAAWPASIDDRAAIIRPLVNSGTCVKFEPLRKFGFRALRLNHLASQLRAHQPGAPGTAGELVHAFTLGVLLAREGDQRPRIPDFEGADSPRGDEGPLARIASALRRALPAVVQPKITERHRQQARRIAWEREFEHRAALVHAARGDAGWRARSCQAVSMPPAPLLPGDELSTGEHDVVTPQPSAPPAEFQRLIEEALGAYDESRALFIAQLNRLYPGRL